MWDSDAKELQKAIEYTVGPEAVEYEIRFRQMFSGILAYTFGRPFASLSHVGVGLKLSPEDREALIAEGGYGLRYKESDPPSKNYTVIPKNMVKENEESLKSWLVTSMVYCKSQPLKKEMRTAMRIRSKAMVTIALPFLTLAACGETPTSIQYPTTTGTMGCVIEQITDGEFGNSHFQGVSDDGKWLSINIFGGENGPSKSGLMNLETGEIEILRADFNNTGNISGDNSTIVAAVSLPDGTTDIVEIDLASREITAIAPDPAYEWLPSYSPDEKTIAFNSYRTGNAEIYIYDRASGELVQLTDDPRYDAHTEFSPDGRKIMFNRMNAAHDNGTYDFDLISIDLASGEETRLTDSPFEEGYGSWAPDGHHIVFSTDKDLNPAQKTTEDPDRRNLYVLDPEGKIIRRLTSGLWDDGYGYWMRDGSYIYFNSHRSGQSEVYRMAMDGLDCVK